jgi:hypothetical protein
MIEFRIYKIIFKNLVYILLSLNYYYIYEKYSKNLNHFLSLIIYNL